MSDHDAIRGELADLAAEVISVSDAARLGEHLAGCADCRAELEELRATVAILRPDGVLPEVDLTSFYRERIAPFVEPRPAVSRWGVLLKVAALALAFAAGFYVRSTLQDPREPAPRIEAAAKRVEEPLARAWRASAEGDSGLSRAALALAALERR